MVDHKSKRQKRSNSVPQHSHERAKDETRIRPTAARHPLAEIKAKAKVVTKILGKLGLLSLRRKICEYTVGITHEDEIDAIAVLNYQPVSENQSFMGQLGRVHVSRRMETWT